MIRKLLFTLVLIGLITAVSVSGTVSFFSDTEVSQDNIMRAAEIDLQPEEQPDWNYTYTLHDMKPSLTRYLNISITFTGTEPGEVYKTITVTNQTDGLHPESENEEDPNGTRNDIANVTDYGIEVIIKNATGDVVRNRTIHTLRDNTTLKGVNTTQLFLGNLQNGWSMEVIQSYHMQSHVTNWAQGDNGTLTFQLMGQQALAPPCEAPNASLITGSRNLAGTNYSIDGAPGAVSPNATVIVSDNHGTEAVVTARSDGSFSLRPWNLPIGERHFQRDSLGVTIYQKASGCTLSNGTSMQWASVSPGEFELQP